MIRRSFKNPPIVEALAALRFSGSEAWTDEQHDAIRLGLKALYPGPARQEQNIEVRTTLDGSDPTTTTHLEPTRVLLPTEEGTALAGYFAGTLSVHVLKPYPGWAALAERMKAAAAVVVEATGADHLLEVAVRYVDRIALPLGTDSSLSEYFSAIPPRPDGMPQVLSAFQCVTQTRDPATGTTATLTTTSVPAGPSEQFAMLYDLNMLRLYEQESRLPFAEYAAVQDELHDQQYRIFIDSVTAKTLELFE